jgi:small subunit ribosomal protein S17
MADAANTATATAERGRRKTIVGTVTGAKMDKTRRVEVLRLTKHPKYGKILRRRTVCHAHDEKNETREGDQVEIMETRPLSKTKRWRVVRIVRSIGIQISDVKDDTGGLAQNRVEEKTAE